MKGKIADPYLNEMIRQKVEELRLEGFALMALIRATGLNKSSAYKWHQGQFDYTDDSLDRIRDYLSTKKKE